jgi:hypothetical protein
VPAREEQTEEKQVWGSFLRDCTRGLALVVGLDMIVGREEFVLDTAEAL